MNPDSRWRLTVGEPNWATLESALPREECEEYMYMGRAGEIELYKHRWTRRYINIAADGQTFYHYFGDMFVEVERAVALDHVRN